MSETNKRGLRLQSLDLLRFPLAVMVVTEHMVSLQGVQAGVGRIDVMRNGAFLMLNDFVDAFLRGISVPIFFFISGYVFFVNMPEMTRTGYARKLRNRAKTLLIPFLVWNALELLLVMVKSLPAFSGFSRVPGVVPTFTVESVLSCFWRYDGGLFPSVREGGVAALYPLNISLWFLRDLMIVVVFTPVLWWALRRLRRAPLVLFFAVWLATPDDNRYHFLATAFLFFSLGAYLSIRRIDLFAALRPLFRPAAVLYPLSCLSLFLIHGHPQVMHWVKVVSILAALPLAYNLAVWLLQKGWVRVSAFLASASFFVYVSHTLVHIRVLKLSAFLFQPESDWAVLLTYVVAEAAVIGLLLSAFWAMRQYTPRLLRIVAGRK